MVKCFHVVITTQCCIPAVMNGKDPSIDLTQAALLRTLTVGVTVVTRGRSNSGSQCHRLAKGASFAAFQPPIREPILGSAPVCPKDNSKEA